MKTITIENAAKYAEILCMSTCGYARKAFSHCVNDDEWSVWFESCHVISEYGIEIVNPFYEGIDNNQFAIACRQAHALENWLHIHQPKLLLVSRSYTKPEDLGEVYKRHQKRLKRIEWCVTDLVRLDTVEKADG